MKRSVGGAILWGLALLVGVAPISKADDDSSSVNLLAGQSASGELAGWKSWHEKPNVKTEDVWRLDSAGVLHCKGTPLGCIYSRKDYADFVLTLDCAGCQVGKRAAEASSCA